jgi:hypothetical protein
LRAFFTDMLTGMSGLLSVPFAALALWASGSGQEILYGLLALLCLLFASYRLWSKERVQSNALLAQKDLELNQKDSLITELRHRMATVVAGQQKPKP